MNVDAGEPRPDFVISDVEGLTVAPDLAGTVADWFLKRGYAAAVNAPYKGAEMIRRYGAPDKGRHSIQIEINRRLYLDADRMVGTEGFAALKRDPDGFAAWLAGYVRGLAVQLS
ncbi:N-formylglutamate amidohydrolase [Nisaea sp.]|uniref:N-formylglutamate amidohydrolase n=1 Tax=Nisaea sp. TaxID=2024842 RepID=UPI003B52BBA0